MHKYTSDVNKGYRLNVKREVWNNEFPDGTPGCERDDPLFNCNRTDTNLNDTKSSNTIIRWRRYVMLLLRQDGVV